MLQQNVSDSCGIEKAHTLLVVYTHTSYYALKLSLLVCTGHDTVTFCVHKSRVLRTILYVSHTPGSIKNTSGMYIEGAPWDFSPLSSVVPPPDHSLSSPEQVSPKVKSQYNFVSNNNKTKKEIRMQSVVSLYGHAELSLDDYRRHRISCIYLMFKTYFLYHQNAHFKLEVLMWSDFKYISL